MLLNRINLDKERTELLRRLRKEACLILVSKHHSKLDMLVFSRRLMAEGIGPVVDVRSFLSKHTSILEAILKTCGTGEILHFSLYDKALFEKGYIEGDPSILESLIEAQDHLDRPIYMVPISFIYKRSLNKVDPSFWDILFGYADNPGVLRKVAIFLRYSRDCLLSIGEPVSLREVTLQKGTSLSDKISDLKLKILKAMDLEKYVCLGPPVKSREEMKEATLTDNKVLEVIEQFAKGDPKKRKKAKREAEKYFEEIAADYSPFYAQLFVSFLTWLWARIFEGIDVREEELLMVKEAARRATLIYVPSHRSHVDYLVLSYVLYKNMLHSPRIAAGVNLLFWPMGKLFRKAGAFFIRRSFRGAKLYTAVFTSYIRMLILEGYPVEFFIEGGRSRTGKLINPKAGLLTLILQSYLDIGHREVAFVPVSITYDKVPEDEGYVKELKGHEKQKESTLQFFKAARFLKRKYGKVYIRFATPIYASEYLTHTDNIDIGEQSQALADFIAVNINKVSVVTPLALISSAILSRFKIGFTKEELASAIDLYLTYLSYNKVQVSNTLSDVDKAIEHTMFILSQWNIIKDIGDQTRSYWGVREDQWIILDYYKNSFLHHILPCSFVCLSLSSRVQASDEVILQDFKFLRFLLQNEFVFEPIDEQRKIADTFKFLINSRLGYIDSAGVFRFTPKGNENVALFTAPLCGILEVYWVVSKEAIRLIEEQGRQSRIIPKNIFRMIANYTELNILRYPEAVNQITVTNAVNLFNTTLKSKKEVERFLGDGSDIYTLSRQIELYIRTGIS